MPKRFIFRQVDYRDIATFIRNGEVRARDHSSPQACHQASYASITNRRGEAAYRLPRGGTVNSYVPFYFSPLTSYSYAIYKGSVSVLSPDGRNLGASTTHDRVFLVANPYRVAAMNLPFEFSNLALNARAPLPKTQSNINLLETFVNWSLFDEWPLAAAVTEIGYNGACKYFSDSDRKDSWRTRKAERMAEFLVRNAIPITALECIVAENEDVANCVRFTLSEASYTIPVHTKPGCFFQ